MNLATTIAEKHKKHISAIKKTMDQLLHSNELIKAYVERICFEKIFWRHTGLRRYDARRFIKRNRSRLKLLKNQSCNDATVLPVIRLHKRYPIRLFNIIFDPEYVLWYQLVVGVYGQVSILALLLLDISG
jgi:hypothetical protein